jgi:hypothetical protein
MDSLPESSGVHDASDSGTTAIADLTGKAEERGISFSLFSLLV